MPRDIEKLRKHRRDWYHRNKIHARTKIKERKQVIREWINEKKTTLSCSKCSENHPATLDFHHSNPEEKEIELARCATNGWSIARIENEISKCIILCSNCHRKLHYNKNI